ncbi:hypothetical protein CEXT_172641 [Caerostris extrusa]|uniref:Uncharacterized protein n=1 Tax=Caerostris extrusa TaxID=172846 RepID=A0AAV4PU11_CAEEX|nr:hypothetical protein CEXT_172641 [Caerostris extrusa]
MTLEYSFFHLHSTHVTNNNGFSIKEKANIKPHDFPLNMEEHSRAQTTRTFPHKRVEVKKNPSLVALNAIALKLKTNDFDFLLEY